MFRSVAHAAAFALIAVPRFVRADCECGYSLKSDNDFAVFTDLIETDFLHASGENLTEYGWRPQEYDVPAPTSRGPLGKRFRVDNLVPNPLKNETGWTGESELGGEAGLQLWVRADNISSGFISGSEMAHVRDDFRHGSYRVGMKLAGENGTCGAFFYFHSDAQEIDLEFLSKEYTNNGGAVNLVLQTPESVASGYDASNTSAYKVKELPFRPDDMFHEYRFDWYSDKVIFYVDGKVLHEMTEDIPVEGGRLFMNHWSNGDPKWSAGPPEKDTAVVVSYVKAYFNSTQEARFDAHRERCPTYDPAKVCAIPAQTVAPDGDAAGTYFFSKDEATEKTPGQIMYKGAASSSFLASTTLLTLLPLFAALFSSAFSL
ncbi:glycoside hydrolase family 16 protein [Sporormia fimetaria CBS 119925]|uniref:Glycoside hydrolase family 16 protein n=1 Tax=Sporormia fimetaria CBS 119925 TaxID=1340428 RepID=A0A6A6V8Q3_9PLEO|nr:glycoside hydrolase family 16 protein [Sporormia fimetaria CBS 119925]